jgi:hypothetical protein
MAPIQGPSPATLQPWLTALLVENASKKQPPGRRMGQTPHGTIRAGAGRLSVAARTDPRPDPPTSRGKALLAYGICPCQ